MVTVKERGRFTELANAIRNVNLELPFAKGRKTKAAARSG
jgi:hypothetical protein